MIDISLVGTGGMIPLHNRFLTSMLARCNGSMLLIDCGEGTQVTVNRVGWGFKNIDYMCFTHFHADHIAGLPGFLLTLGNHGKTEPLTIVGPKGIKYIVSGLRLIAPELPYEIKFIEVNYLRRSAEAVDLKLGEFNVSMLPLDHMIDCFGYSISIPRGGKFDNEKAVKNEVPLKLWSRLQKGETIEHDGRVFTPDMVTGPARKGIKVSYITDTRPTHAIPGFIKDSDLFICEGLYGAEEMKEKAENHKHMIFSEAAKLAKAGNVGELWLTHYSQAMKHPEEYVGVAKNIFQNSVTGYDRLTKSFRFDE